MKPGFKGKNTSEYKDIPIEQTFVFLGTSIDGLSESEATNRLTIFGLNEISEKKKHPLLEFLLRYWGPMPWLLELAMVLSFILRHNFEAIMIFVLLTVNAVIGHIHSLGSQKAVEILKTKLAIKAKVFRDGKWIIEDAPAIVPGDIISTGLGDIVPADAKIVDGELTIDESALTGESLPANKHKSDIVYSGSIAKRGEARCVVLNTGVDTYFGKTAELVKIAKPKSHQIEIMMSIIKYMMYVGIAAFTLVLLYGTITNLKENIFMILTLATIFLMGAVPVALPAILTVVQAIGAMELVKKGVLVTRLDSIEDAASIDVLCLDKTGTITENRLSVNEIVPFSGYRREDVITTARLASKDESMDVIDLAVIEYAKNAEVSLNAYTQLSYTPFDPSLKRTEAVVDEKGKRFRVTKGAVQIIMSLCNGTNSETKGQADGITDAFSQKGYRTLAAAISDDDNLNNLRCVGLLALADSPRPDSKSMIEEARKLGVKPLMLTGDNIAIAREMAYQVGIGRNIIRMVDLENKSEDEQVTIVGQSDGFAEIYPEDKYKIVRLLQSKGHMVGMTGDGVNDAPALKQAEMGIAVSNSTDVAKASASVVLTEPGTRVIIDAIKTSRQTYQRMLSWVINKVAKVIQFVGLLTLGFFLFHRMVLTLLGMTLLVFANDFVTMSLSTDNVKYTTNPNKWNVKNITLASSIIGMLLIVEGAIAILVGVNRYHLDWQEMQTFTMLLLVFTSQFRVFIVRERRYFWSSWPGKALIFSVSATIIGFTLLGIYGLFIPPLKSYQVFFIMGFSALFTFGIDIPKYYIFRKFGL
jgi:H+-transporting ATPase